MLISCYVILYFCRVYTTTRVSDLNSDDLDLRPSVALDVEAYSTKDDEHVRQFCGYVIQF